MIIHHLNTIDSCQLFTQQIDLWLFPLSKLPQQTDSLLNMEEKARANRFVFERHRRRFTVAHAMKRHILARYLSLKPSEITFKTNEYGKPSLSLIGPTSLEFNLSHSGEWGLLAIGKDSPLGVDLEFFSARPYQGIADSAFSPMEAAWIKQQSPRTVASAFFSIWAQKEAFIKAVGMGLSYPTQSFTVLTDKPLIFDEKHHTYWQLQPFMPRIACSAALCCAPEVSEVRLVRVNPDEHVFYTA